MVQYTYVHTTQTSIVLCIAAAYVGKVSFHDALESYIVDTVYTINVYPL